MLGWKIVHELKLLNAHHVKRLLEKWKLQRENENLIEEKLKEKGKKSYQFLKILRLA